MSPRGIVMTLAETAVSAVRHPFRTTGRVVGGAKVVVATGTSVAGSAAKAATSHLHPGQEPEPESGTTQEAASSEAEEETTPQAEEVQAGEVEPQEVEPQVVLREPGPPPEPPIDVVGEALAAEQEEPRFGAGLATEPKATTRDEEHGDAALQRAEAEEIAEEMVEAFPAGEVEIETPVGTTGADVGHNPDTAEADLQQPGTPPLLGEPTVKAVASETKTGRKAARTKKS